MAPGHLESLISISIFIQAILTIDGVHADGQVMGIMQYTLRLYNLSIQCHAMIIKHLWSKFRLCIVASEDLIPVLYGIESPDNTNNHTVISFSFRRFAKTNLKNYCIIFNYSIENPS